MKERMKKKSSEIRMTVLCFHHAISIYLEFFAASSLPCFPRHICERLTNKDVAHWF